MTHQTGLHHAFDFLARLPHAVVTTDAQRRVVSWNAAAESLFGVAAADAVGHELEGVLHVVPCPISQPHVMQQVERSGSWKGEVRLDVGETRFLEVSVCSMDLPPVRWLCMAQDVTEVRATCQALDENDARLRSFLAQAPEAISVLDEHGVVQEWNPELERMSGVSSAHALGRLVWDVMGELLPTEKRNPSHLAFIRLMIEQALKDGQMVSRSGSEFQFKHAAGGTGWLNQVVFPFRTRKGFKFAVVTQEITARKRAEEQLRLGMQQLSGLTANFPGMLFEMSGSPQGTKEVRYVSNQAQTLFGLSPDTPDFLARFCACVAPESRTLFLASLDEAMASRGEWRCEGRFIKSSGGEMWFDCRARCTEEDGHPVCYGVMLDITERKVAERALQESEHRYRSLIEASPDPILMYDLEGNMLACNNPAARAFGVGSAEEFMAEVQHIRQLLPPESLRQALANIQDTLATGLPRKREYTARLKNGSALEVETNSSLMRDANGVPHAIVAIVRDITERRRAAEALRQSEEKLRAFIDQSSDGFLVAGSDGRIQEWNPALTRITGITRAEALGQLIWEVQANLQAPEFRESYGMSYLRQIVEALLAGRVKSIDKPMEITLIHQDGRKVVVDQNVFVLRTGTGPLLGAVIRDVTGQHAAEAQLRQSEERYRLLAERAPLGILYCDAAGMVRSANSRMAQVTGAPSMESLLNVNALELPILKELGLREGMGSCLEQRMDLAQERSVTLANGRTGFFRCRYTPVQESPQALGVLLTVEDITATKEAEAERERFSQQLQHVQKMESIGRLAGGIAHDFNNLLTGIISNISLSLMDLDPADPLYATLTELTRTAHSAARLTRQLLAFSRRQVIEPRVLALGELIDNMRSMLARLLGEDITLRTVIPSDGWNIRADVSQVEQIIVNLVVNARDAMPRGGVLTLELSNVDVSPAEAAVRPDLAPGKHVVLSVMDTGTGMTEEVKSHLFEPFFTTKPPGVGTGLGLATVYGAVRQNHGVIDVQSTLGKGTTFRVYFSRVEEQAQTLSRPVTQELPHGHETILLVEDDTVVRVAAVKILKRLGYTVLPCGNGGEALALAEQYQDPLHMVMTDVVMPGLSGGELVEQLVQLRKGLKVLYTSGHTEDAIVQHGVLESGVSFLGKPYTPHALAQKVRQVLDQDQSR